MFFDRKEGAGRGVDVTWTDLAFAGHAALMGRSRGVSWTELGSGPSSRRRLAISTMFGGRVPCRTGFSAMNSSRLDSGVDAFLEEDVLLEEGGFLLDQKGQAKEIS